jgi:SAM-dependent methyltransferase
MMYAMRTHKDVWNKEYKTSEHLALSTKPSEDLQKFARFLERKEGRAHLNPTSLAVDLGCGNGRNLVYLSEQYGMRGLGYDISDEGVTQARELSRDLPIVYEVRSIDGNLNVDDSSVSLVLDMMTSHFLKEAGREHLIAEIVRILKPGGWLFFKSFLLEEDINAKRMLKEHPADEPYSYIHPSFGMYEHVWTIPSIHEFFEPHFEIHKIEKSHRHLTRQGEANKRRTVSVYLEKV